jgi:hypothetical protein
MESSAKLFIWNKSIEMSCLLSPYLESIIIEHIVAQTIPSISLWSRLQMPFPMNKDKYRANNRSSSSQINVCIMG